MAIFENDPFGGIKEEVGDPAPPAKDVNLFHSNSDVDSGTNAQHHRLGVGHNNASPGDHVHDGISSRKIGTGMGLTLSTGGATQTDVDNLISMLSQVIDFQIVP